MKYLIETERYKDGKGNVWRPREPRVSNPFKIGCRVKIWNRKKRTTGVIVDTLMQLHKGFRNSYVVICKDVDGRNVIVQTGHIVEESQWPED